ncbi:MAG TPA: hypothetical protein PKA33_17820 [Amaricoccus sp.]|uniref:hypothetical protein n=1 Tax=Amaricoccus sp. TaxID=1872485 RepID=UPI002C607380|nr:hypothetical protein [Amaricoccus sp.]HMQ92845.1 hypothetical protein [Amaricoccus sp.]HMR37051.1 hypothetical protein [Paracoccus sp. (in: a-proteobacteria)]HMR54165.1 hypothetical protein [Amaricoccus sp.]HMU01206.1 hypothetical protein [Amaricoccus sp.]
MAKAIESTHARLVDLVRHARDGGGPQRDCSREDREPSHHAADHLSGLPERGIHTALTSIHLGDLRALLHQHHERVHPARERDADVVQLEKEHPALPRRYGRGTANLPKRGAAPLQGRNGLERGTALARYRRRHLISGNRSDAMRLTDVLELEAIAPDRRKERVVLGPKIIERPAICLHIRGVAAHATSHAGGCIDATRDRVGRGCRGSDRGGQLGGASRERLKACDRRGSGATHVLQTARRGRRATGDGLERGAPLAADRAKIVLEGLTAHRREADGYAPFSHPAPPSAVR